MTSSGTTTCDALFVPSYNTRYARVSGVVCVLLFYIIRLDDASGWSEVLTFKFNNEFEMREHHHFTT